MVFQYHKLISNDVYQCFFFFHFILQDVKKLALQIFCKMIFFPDVTQKVTKEMNQDVAEEVDKDQHSTSSSDEEMNRTMPHLPVQDSDSQQETVAHLIQSVEGKVCTCLCVDK